MFQTFRTVILFARPVAEVSESIIRLHERNLEAADLNLLVQCSQRFDNSSNELRMIAPTQLMLPHAQHPPAPGAQRPIHEFIPHDVCVEFLDPELTVVGGDVGMLWTLMPEAAVNEDYEAMF